MSIDWNVRSDTAKKDPTTLELKMKSVVAGSDPVFDHGILNSGLVF